MADKDIVGFGEQSRRAVTRNANWFARFTTTPIDGGGCDVTIEALRGLVLEGGSTSVTLRLRADHGPKVGQCVRVRNHAIVVRERRYDDSGTLWLRSADTGTWYKWSEEAR